MSLEEAEKEREKFMFDLRYWKVEPLKQNEYLSEAYQDVVPSENRKRLLAQEDLRWDAFMNTKLTMYYPPDQGKKKAEGEDFVGSLLGGTSASRAPVRRRSRQNLSSRGYNSKGLPSMSSAGQFASVSKSLIEPPSGTISTYSNKLGPDGKKQLENDANPKKTARVELQALGLGAEDRETVLMDYEVILDKILDDDLVEQEENLLQKQDLAPDNKASYIKQRVRPSFCHYLTL